MRIPIRRRLPLALLAPALLLPALNLYADAPPTVQFEGAVDVRVVNVEAVVTDRSGDRVQGLKAADFRLLVDGREVPIDYFSEVWEGETVQSSNEVESTPAGEPASPPAPTPASVNYLVFVDESTLISAQRDLVLRRIVKDLAKMGAADRLAIVAYDGRRLTRIVDWTMDPAAIHGAFQTVQLRKTRGLAAQGERMSEFNLGQSDGADTVATRPGRGSEGGYAPESAPAGGLTVANDYGPAMRGILAATASMRGMAAPTGRKVLLILTGGWPVPASTQLGTLQNREFLKAQENADLQAFYRPLTETANLLGYSLYPVDVAAHDTTFSWVDSFRPGPTDISRTLSTDYEMAIDAGFEQMARETGGKAILNTARANAFERTAADTRSYYGLGFSPNWQADGQHHDIQLEVRKPGLKVRSRKGFSDLRKTTEVALRNESLLFFGGDEASQRLRLVAGNPSKVGIGKVQVPVTIEMPASSLTALPGPGGTQLQGILSMQALDRWGKRTELGMIELTLNGAGNPAPGDTAHYEAKVVLPKGDQHLVFILRDGAGEGETWGTLDVKAVAVARR